MSTNQLVCIKRPEPGLSTLFEDMYANERLVDVTLSCSNGQLQAHRLVLAACSPYFSGLFDKLVNPFHYPIIIIKDMQLEDMKLILDFMYKGQLTTGRDKLNSLIKIANSLQINGLSNLNEASINKFDATDGVVNINTGVISNINSRNSNSQQRTKRVKKLSSFNQAAMFSRPYNQTRLEGLDDIGARGLSPQPDKLLEQSMVTEDSVDDGLPASHNSSYSHSDPTSTRNLSSQQLQTPSPSSLHVPHVMLHADPQHAPQHQQHNHHHLNNQLQVLSHSLSANRTSSGHSMGLASSNNNHHQQTSNQLSQQTSRSRVHPCSICWKTFREKANLKRHLQVHSIDRVVYACPDCNKTFSWKDNYIRHTKTAHHMNNLRQPG